MADSRNMQMKKTLYISVIDNDEMIQTMLVRILNMLDIDKYKKDIKVFEDGLQFFESKRLEESGEHLLLLDGIMPVMDGLEILQQIRREKRKNVHVLMLSGRKSQSEIDKALKFGADDYVTKPFSIKVLQERIQHLIRGME